MHGLLPPLAAAIRGQGHDPPCIQHVRDLCRFRQLAAMVGDNRLKIQPALLKRFTEALDTVGEVIVTEHGELPADLNVTFRGPRAMIGTRTHDERRLKKLAKKFHHRDVYSIIPFKTLQETWTWASGQAPNAKFDDIGLERAMEFVASLKDNNETLQNMQWADHWYATEARSEKGGMSLAHRVEKGFVTLTGQHLYSRSQAATDLTTVPSIYDLARHRSLDLSQYNRYCADHATDARLNPEPSASSAQPASRTVYMDPNKQRPN